MRTSDRFRDENDVSCLSFSSDIKSLRDRLHGLASWLRLFLCYVMIGLIPFGHDDVLDVSTAGTGMDLGRPRTGDPRMVGPSVQGLDAETIPMWMTEVVLESRQTR